MGTRGPVGLFGWPKATSPPQELEVGACRPSYILVIHILGVSVITYLLGSLGNNKDDETVLYTN